MAWLLQFAPQAIDIVSAYSGPESKKVWLDHEIRWYCANTGGIKRELVREREGVCHVDANGEIEIG